jgi:hypothetical protein
MGNSSLTLFLVLFFQVGVTHDLIETARWLRKLGKQTDVVILANKLEGKIRWISCVVD